MSLSVWKFPIQITDDIEVMMPRGAKVLHADMQANRPFLWALVAPGEPPEVRGFRLAGTGHSIGDYEVKGHISTLMLDDGALVFHLFEKATEL